jgi:hypothetical protein
MNSSFEPSEADAVLKQLERLLEHPAFRRSGRCTKLLRYLVEHSLVDAEFHPKERTLAIEVFGRKPDYDTAADPIVRTTANDIRKRLGVYFHDTGAAAAMLIELPSGSYRPIFKKPVPVPTSQMRTAAQRPRLLLLQRRPVPVTLMAGAALIIVACAWLIGQRMSLTNSDRFWQPFLTSSRRVLICPPDPNSPEDASNLVGHAVMGADIRPVGLQTPMIAMSDSKAVWRVLSVLGKRQDSVVVRTSDRVQAHDLRDGPSIIIGGRNNPWSTLLLSSMRFQIVSEDSSQSLRIVDSQAPSDRRWSIESGKLSNKSEGRAFALVTRVVDPTSDNAVVDIAGIGPYATAAAGEFIAQRRYLNNMGNTLVGCDRNLQLVLSAQATVGAVSEPRVEAIHCW